MNNTPISNNSEHHRFVFFCDEWMRLQKSRVKASTYARYDTALEQHIKPGLGDYLPLTMSTQIVEAFKQSLLEKDKLAPKTVEQRYGL